MLLDLNFKFKDLTGKEVDEQLPSHLFAVQISNHPVEGLSSLKADDIARKIYADHVVELDTADLDILERSVEKMQFSPLAKAAIIRAFIKAREIKDIKKEENV